MTERTVECVYFKRTLPALTEAPVAGALGEQLLSSVSQPAWNQWMRVEQILVKYFDHDPRSRTFQRQRALAITEFFFGPPSEEHLVECRKFGFALPGLKAPPFPGTLGMRIYNEVSIRAWNLWPEQERILINHYGLSLVDPQSQRVLLQAMEDFFFGEGAQLPEGWTPPTAAPSKGGPR